MRPIRQCNSAHPHRFAVFGPAVGRKAAPVLACQRSLFQLVHRPIFLIPAMLNMLLSFAQFEREVSYTVKKGKTYRYTP